MIIRKFIGIAVISILALCGLFGQDRPTKLAAILADGKVHITIAQGYIEEKQRSKLGAQEHLHQLNHQYLTLYLSANQYHSKPSTHPNLHQFEKTTWLNYKNLSGRDTTAQVTLEITLIMPGAGSKKHFINAIQNAEILVYQGHGRRGLGPDFDDIKQSRENFVIGLNSTLHRSGKVFAPGDRLYGEVSVGKNDLEGVPDSIWPPKSRFWFFNVCNSRYYLDEFQSDLLPEAVRSHTDILLTNSLISVYATAASTTRYLDLLLSGCPLEKIPPKLFEAQQTELYQSGLYNASVIQSFRTCYYWSHLAEAGPEPTPTAKKKLPSTKRR